MSYEVLAAAHPAWADRAGTFRAALDPPELRVAEALARDLVEALPANPRPDGTRGHGVRRRPQRDAPARRPHGTAAELLSDLVDRARQHPVAVVQLAAEVLDGGDVRVAFASVGIEPVTFQVEPGVAAGAAGGRRAVARRPVPTAGPVLPRGAARRVLPGRFGPASLAAGRTARGLLPGGAGRPAPGGARAGDRRRPCSTEAEGAGRRRPVRLRRPTAAPVPRDEPPGRCPLRVAVLGGASTAPEPDHGSEECLDLIHFSAGNVEGGVVLAYGLLVRPVQEAVHLSLGVVVELQLADPVLVGRPCFGLRPQLSMSAEESLRPSWKSMNFGMCHP